MVDINHFSNREPVAIDECYWTWDWLAESWETNCGRTHISKPNVIINNIYEHCPYCGRFVNVL